MCLNIGANQCLKNYISNSIVGYKSQLTAQMEDSSLHQLRRLKVHSIYNLDLHETEILKLHFKMNISYSKMFQVQLFSVVWSLVKATLKPATLTTYLLNKEKGNKWFGFYFMCYYNNMTLSHNQLQKCNKCVQTIYTYVCVLYVYKTISKTLFPEGCNEKTQDDFNLHQP